MKEENAKLTALYDDLESELKKERGLHEKPRLFLQLIVKKQNSAKSKVEGIVEDCSDSVDEEEMLKGIREKLVEAKLVKLGGSSSSSNDDSGKDQKITSL